VLAWTIVFFVTWVLFELSFGFHPTRRTYASGASLQAGALAVRVNNGSTMVHAVRIVQGVPPPDSQLQTGSLKGQEVSFLDKSYKVIKTYWNTESLAPPQAADGMFSWPQRWPRRGIKIEIGDAEVLRLIKAGQAFVIVGGAHNDGASSFSICRIQT
jgi:hypothetical protein